MKENINDQLTDTDHKQPTDHHTTPIDVVKKNNMETELSSHVIGDEVIVDDSKNHPEQSKQVAKQSIYQADNEDHITPIDDNNKHWQNNNPNFDNQHEARSIAGREHVQNLNNDGLAENDEHTNCQDFIPAGNVDEAHQLEPEELHDNPHQSTNTTIYHKDEINKKHFLSLACIKKHRKFFPFLLIGIILLVYKWLSPTAETMQQVTWEENIAQHTCKVQYYSKGNTNLQAEFPHLIHAIVKALDSATSESALSKFNTHNCSPFYDQAIVYLYEAISASKSIYNQTQGAFDPTIAPLARTWQKAIKQGEIPQQSEINELLDRVSLDYIVANETRIKKLKEGVRLDLNSLIPGYSALAIKKILNQHGVQHMCIEIGNEKCAYGYPLGIKDRAWIVTYTISHEQFLIPSLIVKAKLNNQGTAMLKTYAPWEHKKIGMIIDPHTGKWAQNNLIATIVFADNCMLAKGFATAFLAKGFAFAKDIVANTTGVEAILIYKNNLGDTDIYYSQGIKHSYLTEDSTAVMVETYVP